MQHRRALSYVFERQDWATSLLLLTVALLVPLVGPVVAFGYQAALVEHLARSGDRNWPPFDLSRLADYLQRGLRVFVVSLLVSVVVTPLAMVVLFAGNLTALLLYDRESPLAIVFVGIVVVVEAVAFLAVVYGGMALATPLWLRAALDPDLAGAFDAGFVRDFLGRVWKPLLLSHAFMLAVSSLLFLAGVLACFVGVFPAMALLLLVQAHVYAQLYRLHLERGGRPAGGATGGPEPAGEHRGGAS
jgi:hypothetical protein